MIQLAVLVPALSLGALTANVETAAPAAQVAQAEAAAQTVFAQEGGEAAPAGGEVGFLEKYFPFTLNEGLEPEVQDNLVVLWILNLLPFGGTWGPLVVLSNPEGDFVVDTLLIQLVHYVTNLVGIIPILGWLYVIGNVFYLTPVASINELDRSIKRAKAEGRWKPKGAALGLPGEPSIAAVDVSAGNMAF